MKLDEGKIIAYLLGELEVEEATAVQQALAEDAHWQAVATDYKQLLTGFREQRVNQYTLEVSQALPPSNQASPPKGSLWFRIGAWLVSLLAVFGLLWYIQGNTHSPQKLATQYFILPNDPSVAGQNEVEATFRDGLTAFFRQKEYEEASRLFDSLREHPTLGLRAQFYEGHARFLSGNYPTAEERLQHCLDQAESFSRIERTNLRWNLLMAQLAQGQDIRAPLENEPDSERKQQLLEELGPSGVN